LELATALAVGVQLLVLDLARESTEESAQELADRHKLLGSAQKQRLPSLSSH
jgi:hypothetical protein